MRKLVPLLVAGPALVVASLASAGGCQSLAGFIVGMQGGELIIVAARPSMGKTSFALNLTERVANRRSAA